MRYLSTQTDSRGVTSITFNRPDAANALNRDFIDELTVNLEKVRDNTRILVIAANGKHFCAGADVHWMKQSADLSADENHADAMALSNLLQILDTFSCPTIARVQGAALGSGTGIVCCCDIVVAAEDSRFAFTQVKSGLIPATISPYAVAAIGPRAARRYFLTAETIDVLDAYRLGLVHDVCSTNNLGNRVEDKIAALLSGGKAAQSAAKKLIAEVAHHEITDELRQQLATRLADVCTGKEAQEGLAALIEKRPAKWN